MRKALVIGIDKYSTAPLRGCVNDANRIAAALESGSAPYETRRLLNEAATRKSIRENLIWLFSDSDQSVLFFAGHGWRRPTGTYLVTHDFEIHDEGIELQWLSSAVRKLAKTGNTAIFLIDACHSGDGTVRTASSEDEDMKAEDLRQLTSGGSGKVLMAACRGSEVALEEINGGINHGTFTHNLCCAMEGEAANSAKDITINAAFDFVSEKLKAKGQQTPVFKGDQEGAVVLLQGIQKVGTWKYERNNSLSTEEVNARADELLNTAKEAISSASFDEWQRQGHAAACRTFEPILTWFRRRVDHQPQLLNDASFKRRYESCVHIHKQLCALSPGGALPSGIINENIGAGSFGSVWTISGGSWATPVCLKGYHAHDILDHQKVSRFRRGYEAMRQLDHPNIVKVRELTEVPFGFYMDFIEGANLRNLNPGASREPNETVKLLIEIAETLHHAHQRGVIHRDVKPENIIVSIDENNECSAFLTDFDLAWFSAATQITKLADGFGSHFYAAPEQINSPQSNVAHKATVDVYAFGQLCFYSICGRDPMAFDRDSNSRTLESELGRKWPDARASAEMLSLFNSCTESSPGKRMQDFREVCERLSKIQVQMSASAGELSADRFIEQLAYLLVGRLPTKGKGLSVSVRSRSGRTQFEIVLSREAESLCAVETFFHPEALLIEGKKSSDVRALVNTRIDNMLTEFKKDHSAARKGAKAGAFEASVYIERLPKTGAGALKAKEIISRVIDILEHVG